MNRKNIILFTVLAAMATVYVVYFTNWFRPKTLHIYHTVRNLTPQYGASSSLMFGLEGTFRLTEIKVVPLAGYEADHAVAPVWHLVSQKYSRPLKYFSYGQQIEGMDPAVAGEEAHPLDPTTTYRIFVSAGKVKGFHDFTLSKPAATEATANAGN